MNSASPPTETVTRAMLVWWLGDAASMLRSGGNHTHARMLRLAAEQLGSSPADGGDALRTAKHLLRRIDEAESLYGAYLCDTDFDMRQWLNRRDQFLKENP